MCEPQSEFVVWGQMTEVSKQQKKCSICEQPMSKSDEVEGEDWCKGCDNDAKYFDRE